MGKVKTELFGRDQTPRLFYMIPHHLAHGSLKQVGCCMVSLDSQAAGLVHFGSDSNRRCHDKLTPSYLGNLALGKV